ncbi:hypothetical protein V490_04842 [Pseudogymnoascus sp. VKM F-3557]|nr:hypothetical protein V490_04842 [Pseudogymnoascus sp. VKM F-3557]
MEGSIMEVSDTKRKATRSLRGSSKRAKIESSGIDPAFFSSDSDGDGNYSDHGESDASHDEDPEPTETPQTPFSPPQRKFPSELKTIKCTYDGCTKTFNRPVRLASHLRSHTNERPFACTYADCDKAYIEEKHLKQHIKGSHTHERNHHYIKPLTEATNDSAAPNTPHAQRRFASIKPYNVISAPTT